MRYEDVVDIPSAKERFMGNYGLFSRFLYSFPSRSLYGDLQQALSAGDVKKAFEIAHTMKGIVGNLSLKRISAPLSDMVETLRAGMLPDAAACAALKEAYDTTVEAIVQMKAENKSLF